MKICCFYLSTFLFFKLRRSLFLLLLLPHNSFFVYYKHKNHTLILCVILLLNCPHFSLIYKFRAGVAIAIHVNDQSSFNLKFFFSSSIASINSFSVGKCSLYSEVKMLLLSSGKVYFTIVPFFFVLNNIPTV